MTTSQLINKVKSILDEYGVTSGSYENNELIDALTVGQNSVWSILATDTMATGFKHPLLHNLIVPELLTVGSVTNTIIDNVIVKTGLVSLSQNQVYYPLQVFSQIPSEITQWVKIQPNEIYRGWIFRDTNTGYYHISGDVLFWYTKNTLITSNTQFLIEHIVEPPALSATQNPTIPADSLLINYAVYMLLHKLNKSEISQIFYNAFIQELAGVRYAKPESNA